MIDCFVGVIKGVHIHFGSFRLCTLRLLVLGLEWWFSSGLQAVPFSHFNGWALLSLFGFDFSDLNR